MDARESKYFEAYLEQKFVNISKEIAALRSDQDKIGKNVDDLCSAIENIRISEAAHLRDCPNTKSVRALEANVGKLMEIRTNWKVYLIALCVIIVVCVSAGAVAVDKLKNSIASNKSNIANIQNEKK